MTYEPTGLGESLLGPIEAFGEWAFRHGDKVLAAQDRAARGGRQPAIRPLWTV